MPAFPGKNSSTITQKFGSCNIAPVNVSVTSIFVALISLLEAADNMELRVSKIITGTCAGVCEYIVNKALTLSSLRDKGGFPEKTAC